MTRYIVFGQERRVYEQVKSFSIEVEADNVDAARSAAETCYYDADHELNVSGSRLRELVERVASFDTPVALNSEGDARG